MKKSCKYLTIATVSSIFIGSVLAFFYKRKKNGKQLQVTVADVPLMNKNECTGFDVDVKCSSDCCNDRRILAIFSEQERRLRLMRKRGAL